jgi:hypothetical protein
MPPLPSSLKLNGRNRKQNLIDFSRSNEFLAKGKKKSKKATLKLKIEGKSKKLRWSSIKRK